MPREPARRVRQLGEHQVDDVLGQVVLAARDEDLGAGDRGNEPSGRPARRVVRMRPRSVPAWASVRHIVPLHTPLTIFGR